MRLTNAFFLRPAACCCCVMWDILVCETRPTKPEKPRHNFVKFGSQIR